MLKIIPRNKLSKKVKKQLDRAARTLWTIDPRTRSPQNPAAYNRSKEKAQARKEF